MTVQSNRLVSKVHWTHQESDTNQESRYLTDAFSKFLLKLRLNLNDRQVKLGLIL